MTQTTTSKSIIDFLIGLNGFDKVQTRVGDARHAAIDLSTGQIIEADTDYPEGNKLLVDFSSENKISVYTHKLIETLFLKHAYACSITNPEGGGVRDHYDHIKHHLEIKTGFTY